jgi:hypothetical protein
VSDADFETELISEGLQVSLEAIRVGVVAAAAITPDPD